MRNVLVLALMVGGLLWGPVVGRAENAPSVEDGRDRALQQACFKNFTPLPEVLMPVRTKVAKFSPVNSEIFIPEGARGFFHALVTERTEGSIIPGTRAGQSILCVESGTQFGSAITSAAYGPDEFKRE